MSRSDCGLGDTCGLDVVVDPGRFARLRAEGRWSVGDVAERYRSEGPEAWADPDFCLFREVWAQHAAARGGDGPDGSCLDDYAGGGNCEVCAGLVLVAADGDCILERRDC